MTAAQKTRLEHWTVERALWKCQRHIVIVSDEKSNVDGLHGVQCYWHDLGNEKQTFILDKTEGVH